MALLDVSSAIDAVFPGVLFPGADCHFRKAILSSRAAADKEGQPRMPRKRTDENIRQDKAEKWGAEKWKGHNRFESGVTRIFRSFHFVPFHLITGRVFRGLSFFAADGRGPAWRRTTKQSATDGHR
jgi:hypothetical protein